MAREKSLEKRAGLLQAAIEEITVSGLAASTASIARRAGVAEGTLFTYFATKDMLFNELYLELKQATALRLMHRFPARASLQTRVKHVWTTYLEWALQSRPSHRASVLLHLSNVLLPETRAFVDKSLQPVHETLEELSASRGMRSLPRPAVSTLMRSMQDWVLGMVEAHPKDRERLIRQGFRIFWRSTQ